MIGNVGCDVDWRNGGYLHSVCLLVYLFTCLLVYKRDTLLGIASARCMLVAFVENL